LKHLNFDAFADELVKISEARDPVNRERVIRALQGALVAGGGYGLGWGLGNLAMNVGLPKNIQSLMPGPRTMGIGGAGVAGLSFLANQALKNRVRDHIRAGDNEKRDFLMGHSRLNPSQGVPNE